MSDAHARELPFEAFAAVDLRVGRVLRCEPNIKARKPAYVLSIDLGALGVKLSSAQLTSDYEAAELVGRCVVCVCNLPPRRVAGIKSEVLVLAGLCPEAGTRLLAPDRDLPPGTPVC